MSISQYPAASGGAGTSLAGKLLKVESSNQTGTVTISSSSSAARHLLKKFTDNTLYTSYTTITSTNHPDPADFADKKFYVGSPSNWNYIGDMSDEVLTSTSSQTVFQYPTASFTRFGDYVSATTGVVFPQQLSGNDFLSIKYLKLGSSGRKYVSNNGNTWEDGGYVAAAGYNSIYDSVYANGVLVACGDSAKVIVSNDRGGTFTSPSVSVSGNLRKVEYENSLFWVFGSGSLAYSADGQTWTASTISGLSTSVSFTYGNGVYVLADRQNRKVYKSTDGTTWTQIVDTLFPSGDYQKGIQAVAYGDSKFVAIGGQKRVYVSTDAVSWDIVADNDYAYGSLPLTDLNDFPTDLQYIDNIFTILGTSTIVQSTDGVNWKQYGNYAFGRGFSGKIQKDGNEYYVFSGSYTYKTTELSKIAERFGIALHEAKGLA